MVKEVSKFKYLESVLCNHNGTEVETRERVLQRGKVAGSLRHIKNGRSVSMGVKRDLRNTMMVLILTYTSKTMA